MLVTTYGQRGTLYVKRESVASRNRYIKMNVSEDELTPVAPQKEPTQRVIHAVRSESSSHVPNQLDLRGKRYEEAQVDQFGFCHSGWLSSSDYCPRKRNRRTSQGNLIILKPSERQKL